MASAEFWGHILIDLNKSIDLWVSLPSTVNETIVYMGTLKFGFYQIFTWLTRVLLGLQNTF
jgi:hypothetical protein